MRKAAALSMTMEQRRQLEAWVRGKTVSARLLERSKILLMLADGYGVRPTAESLDVTPNTVRRWRDRFVELGCAGVEKDAPGRGRKPRFGAEIRAAILRRTTQEKPEQATHWSVRRMAKAVGVSQFYVWTTWQENGLKPHLVRTFKISNDPHFAEKVEDIMGLYLNPPEHKRNGTTTLFAALNTLDGTVIAETMSRHRHQEWLRFLKLVEQQVPKEKQIHVICDNYATHKHEKVQK